MPERDTPPSAGPGSGGPRGMPRLPPVRRPALPSPGTARRRLAALFAARWSRSQAVVGVLLAALGFAAVVQVRANDENSAFVGARQADLISLINTLSLATDRAEVEIADLQATRDALLDDAEATQTALAVTRGRVETLEILTGTIPVVGTGVRITVKTEIGEVGTEQLLNGLEELRNAGAEAVEINDEVRVVAQTGITESPRGALVVDGTALQPPYVLDVIGAPQTLATALEFDGGFIEDIEEVGGSVTVEELDEVSVDTTREPEPLEFAEPLEQE